MYLRLIPNICLLFSAVQCLLIYGQLDILYIDIILIQSPKIYIKGIPKGKKHLTEKIRKR